ncbi:MAG TPA: DUF2059 domain-containing protein [Thermoanaerobaculia bacterium]|nr:DUF2059 domain-containing protein [Thermoanaerobaculia bacterium]
MFKPAFRGRAAGSAVLFFLVIGAVAAVPASAEEPAALSSHEQAARELIGMVGGEDLATAVSDMMLSMFGQDPEMAPYEEVIRTWTRKVFGSGDLESELARVYMDTFTEAEIREITAFYRTPVGQKTVAKMPELMQKGAAIGMRLAGEHSAELTEMIEKAKAEVDAAKKKEQKDPNS